MPPVGWERLQEILPRSAKTECDCFWYGRATVVQTASEYGHICKILDNKEQALTGTYVDHFKLRIWGSWVRILPGAPFCQIRSGAFEHRKFCSLIGMGLETFEGCCAKSVHRRSRQLMVSIRLRGVTCGRQGGTAVRGSIGSDGSLLESCQILFEMRSTCRKTSPWGRYADVLLNRRRDGPLQDGDNYRRNRDHLPAVGARVIDDVDIRSFGQQYVEIDLQYSTPRSCGPRACCNHSLLL